MTIKQLGGIFGRNPTFEDVTIEGTLTFDDDIDVNSDLKVAGDIETTGNVIIATSGNGIDFSATSGTGTSELFDDYEEGTWTPVISSTSGTITSYTVYSALYTKIGRVISISTQFAVLNNGTGAGNISIAGLPFASSLATCGVIYNQSTGILGLVTIATSGTTGTVANYDNSYPVATGQTIQLSLTYPG